MTGDGRVRVAGAADMQAMRDVAGACAEAPQWGEGVWRGVLAGNRLREGWVAEIDGAVVGFVVVSCVGEIAEVESLAVLSAARRRGVGRALCVEGMRWARGIGARSVELEVRESSEAALGLYRALGFVEQGRRRRYYHQPEEDAVLMGVELGGPGSGAKK